MSLKAKVKKLFGAEPELSIKWLNDAYDYTRHTPDIAFLEMSENQLVFVCDEMSRKHPKNELILEHGSFLCQAFTEERFTMFKKRLGKESFPVPIRNQFNSFPFAQIKGELWKINSTHLIMLDKHKQNGVQFRRKRVKITVPFINITHKASEGLVHTERSYSLYAWMYVGKQAYWDEMYENGKSFLTAVKTYVPNKLFKKPYFLYTTGEYSDNEPPKISQEVRERMSKLNIDLIEKE